MICAALIGSAAICGCGRNNASNQTTQSQSAPIPTKWNDAYAQLSPFTKIGFTGDAITVTYENSEYQLVAIDDLAVADVVAFCRSHYRDWQKRFAEDLVVVLSDMGHPLNAEHTVSLSLIDPVTIQKKEIASARMNRENRDAIMMTRLAKAKSPLSNQ